MKGVRKGESGHHLFFFSFACQLAVATNTRPVACVHSVVLIYGMGGFLTLQVKNLGYVDAKQLFWMEGVFHKLWSFN